MDDDGNNFSGDNANILVDGFSICFHDDGIGLVDGLSICLITTVVEKDFRYVV